MADDLRRLKILLPSRRYSAGNRGLTAAQLHAVTLLPEDRIMMLLSRIRRWRKMGDTSGSVTRYLVLYALAGLPAFRMILRWAMRTGTPVEHWGDALTEILVALAGSLLFGILIWPYVLLIRGLDRTVSPAEFLGALAGETEAERLSRRRRAAERRERPLRDLEQRVL